MPALRETSVVLVYIDWLTMGLARSHFPQLRKITLDADEESSEDDELVRKVWPKRFVSVVENETMPRLRVVRVKKQLDRFAVDYDSGFDPGWYVRQCVGRLDEWLKNKAREDERQREGNGDTAVQDESADDLLSENEAGVVFFGPKRKT